MGQVDLFALRKARRLSLHSECQDSDPGIAEAFRNLMPPGRGELVIVKTVFEEIQTWTQQAF